ncbi:MAG: serine/threonine protein kinase, partial [Myxococcales bacterium]|nr:serine/threonine protein kinase [Myxococcales bacterium]
MTTGGACPTDGELADYIGGRLAPDLEVVVREHCDACAACRGALVALASATTGSGGPPPSLSGGRYRVLRVLGEGGMGVVYEALDDRLGRVVAIKTLHPRTQDDAELAEDRARFAREIQAIASLRSPHVVQILDVVSEPDGSSGFVMERLDGEPLRSLLARERRLPVSRALTIAEQILAALAAAHDAGLVHRDVKPENVFLVRSAAGDLVKLLDFGLAKPTRLSAHEMSITGRPMLLGTVAYMAPEQARGDRATPAVDVYAVGTILFEMICGERPYAGASGDVLAAKLLGGERRTFTSLAPDAPGGVSAVVERLLASAPEDRPSSAAALADLASARGALPADRAA